jgi:hypothetical protein
MRIEQTHVQRSKAVLHAVQTVVTFIAACLALSILTKPGGTGPAIGFYFALVCPGENDIEEAYHHG